MDFLAASGSDNVSTTPQYQDWEISSRSSACALAKAEWIAVAPILVLVISVLGILLNTFVLLIFCIHKKACTVAEIFLSNLAAADLLLVSCLPFWAVYISNGFNWTFGGVLCRLVNLSITINAYGSIYFLVMVSIDRYLAVVHPLSHGRLRTPRYAKLACFFVWAFGLLMGVPTLVYRKTTYSETRNKTGCILNYPNDTVHMVFEGMLTLFGFIIPVAIISFCTVKILHTLKEHMSEMLGTQKMDNRATTLVLAVLLTFLICWVPFHVLRIPDHLHSVNVLRMSCRHFNILDMWIQILLYLGFFNSVLNPILYVIVGKTFRKKVVDTFLHFRERKGSTLRSNTASTKL